GPARARAGARGGRRRAGTSRGRPGARAGADPPTPEDGEGLQALAVLYRRFHGATEGRVADPVTVLRAAEARLPEVRWLAEADVLLVDDLELDAVEREFVAALARSVSVRLVSRRRPP